MRIYEYDPANKYNARGKYLGQTPIAEQAVTACMNYAKQTGKIVGHETVRGTTCWYSENGFICNH